jgi:hypothetical protein
MYGRFVSALATALALLVSATAAQAQGPVKAVPIGTARHSATPTPLPALAQPGLITHLVPFDGPPQPYIAPPGQLQTTGDANVCTDHGGPIGALACGEAFQEGWLVLVWNWQAPNSYSDPSHPNTQYTVVRDIDGFHMYEVVPDGNSGAHAQLVSTTSAGADATITAFNPAQRDADQRCFQVRAYKGQLESTDSWPFCIGNGQQPTAKTISLAPSSIRTITHRHSDTGSLLLGNLDSCGGHSDGNLVVGFVHCNDGPDQVQEVWRVLAKFDAGTLGPVFKATLKFHRDSTALVGTDPQDNNQSTTLPADEPLHGRTDANCASEVLLPTYDWVGNGWDDSDEDSAPPVTNLPTTDYAPIPLLASDVALDVTDLVIQWRQFPQSNNGFALRTWDELTQEENNDSCVSAYRDFSLEVTEMPPSGAVMFDPGTLVVPGAP